jgi:protein-L-isoaspartate(D-aspartate) O-methyltransferase
MMADIESEVRITRDYIHKDMLDLRVMAAMREVPRHEFVPEQLRFSAYSNGPVAIGHGQTISQPYIVALMTDLLSPAADDVILDVGTGSGYQAAILSKLVRQVYSIENVESLAIEAQSRLAGLGYDNVEVKHGDGYYGWPEHAPYDGIVVAAAAPHIPAPLMQQLKVGARLVLPVGGEYWGQQLIMVEKIADDQFRQTNVLAVSFVPLTGADHDQPAKQEWLKGKYRKDNEHAGH